MGRNTSGKDLLVLKKKHKEEIGFLCLPSDVDIKKRVPEATSLILESEGYA